MFKDLNGVEYVKWNGDNEGLNYDSDKGTWNPKTVIYNKKLYLFWQEYNKSNTDQIRCKYYDGTKWSDDDGSLNYDTSKPGYNPNSIISNDNIYLFWNENNSNNRHQIRYKYYDGAKWHGNNSSLNYDSNESSSHPNSIIYNNILYLFWVEASTNNKYQVRYKYYDGEKWCNDNGSLNYYLSENAHSPNSIILNNNLYVFWQEINEGVSQIRYKYYDGTKWHDDDGSLNYDMSKNAISSNSTIFNNNLYVFWIEYNASNKYQIRYKYYDNIKWNSDNGSLNYNVNKEGTFPSSIVFGNNLYVFWREHNETINQIRYKYFDSNKWSSDNTSLNYDVNKDVTIPNSIIFNDNLYAFWSEHNPGNIFQIRYKYFKADKYLIKNNNSIYQMNPLSKLRNITQSNLTSETFMEYGSNKLTLNEDEYNELSEDAEVLVYNSSQKELKLHKNVTYDKRFIMTLDKPKIRIKPNNPDSKPKLMLNAYRLMEYKYDVKIDTLEKPIKEVIGIKYDIDDEAIIRKDTFKTSENPYVATITVEQENGDIVKKNGNLTLYNREPKLLITMTEMLMRLEIGDDDKNKIKYRMLLNGKQIYPLDGDWSNYFDTPYSIARKFKSNEISVGRNNVIQVFVKDEYEKQSSLTYNFIGEYSGLLFCDELGGYYSDDLGNIVKRLNFGNILAGKTSEVKTVYLKNACGYNIKNVVIKVTENLIPSGSDILIDSEKDNFIGSHEIKIERLPNEQVIPFYIRVKTDIEQEQGGRFEITVNSTSSEI